MASVKLAATLWAVAACAATASAESWQVVATEQGKHVEIDRDSIVADPRGGTNAKGRVVLDKPIVDPRTSVSYRTIEVTSHFDCEERTHATLKRSYYKENGELLRFEEVKSPFDMPVRSGTPDDKLLREVCRPKGAGASSSPASSSSSSSASAPSAAQPTASQLAEKAHEAAVGLRQYNEALVEHEVKRDAARSRSRARTAAAFTGRPSAVRPKPAPVTAPVAEVAWAYEGSSGPDAWGRLRPEYAQCGAGRRQAPIDIRGGIAVDLEPLQFFYRPASFRVVDSEKALMLLTYGGGLSLLGKNYALTQVLFHRPAEITVDGHAFAMDAQLTHRADDGKLAIVVVLLEKGAENPVVQMALNNLPLEHGSEVSPPALTIDVEQLLPADRRYYTFMGSLSMPPCTEDVLWVVLKTPQQISAEQLSIFERLYRPNARPVQPSFGRIIKESR